MKYLTVPKSAQLPYALYTAEQVRRFDQLCSQQYGLAGAELMARAGQAVFDQLLERWPHVKVITVVTGVGNNAGDGFVVARLAIDAGLKVELLQVGDGRKLSGDALFYKEALDALSGQFQWVQEISVKTDVIIDAVLGTGLCHSVSGLFKRVIDQMNQHQADVLTIDIPSGLQADTGVIMGSAVKAAATVSFIALKRGLFTGAGRECCGELVFDALAIPARVYAHEILNCRRMDWLKVKQNVSVRKRNAHKGDFGHVLVVGGDVGFSGAVRLAGQAALRTGAGLVSIATRKEHATSLNIGCPELMVHPVVDVDDLTVLIERASVIVLGPGLGRSTWAKTLFEAVWCSSRPLILDADGLNLLAEISWDDKTRQNLCLTPHPGEAARLLSTTIMDVESDRFQTVEKLHAKFSGSVVLKGSGSLIKNHDHQPIALCSDGNPGMASGGMGDVLTGIIAALFAQGLAMDEAACTGVCLHAAAADRAAQQGEVGLLAHDLFSSLRHLINA